MAPSQSSDPPSEPLCVTTIDAHVAGEPLRVITGGWPELPGESMLAKRRWAQKHCEPLRRALMWEPRGHADMYGCVLTRPTTSDGDVGVLFLHNEGYSTMCGHGIIGLVKVGVEFGLFRVASDDPSPLIRIDTPAGRIAARAHLSAEGGGPPGAPEEPRVGAVSFVNVPSFVLGADLAVDVPGHGAVRCDIAFGGAFYAYVEADDLGLELTPGSLPRLIETGMRVKRAVAEQTRVAHPVGDPELGFLYGTIFVGPAGAPGVHSRNVCVFADGEVDRSPTGTGVSGRAAIHHARGDLPVGRSLTIESLLGTRFDVRVTEITAVGGLPAVVPEVTGTAHITGRHEFVIHPDDPLAEGFLLR